MNAPAIRIIVSVVLLCAAAALAFSMHKNKNNPSSIYTKALFRIKSVRFFPVVSLVYAYFAVVCLFFGLLIVNHASGYEQLFKEHSIATSMRFEKRTRKYPYSLMQIEGREDIREEHPKILVIGDSFVWGDGITNLNQIWWGILRSELERRGYDCAVYAVGWGGFSTYEEFLWLRDKSILEDIQPDLIIIGYVTNDPDMARLDESMGIKLNLPKSYTKYDSWLRSINPSVYDSIDTYLGKALDKSENRFNNAEYGYQYSTWESKLVESGNLEIYNTHVVRPLAEFVLEKNIPLIVIPTPSVPHRDAFEAHYQAVLPLFEQAGLPVHNPLDSFVALYADQLRKGNIYNNFMVSRINPHPGPATSSFLGQYAADVLEQNYASILGEKRDRDKSRLSIEINDWMPYMLNPRAIRESGSSSQYTIDYPDQSSKADLTYMNPLRGEHGNFLTLPLSQKYVKLDFKYPVKLSSIKIEGEDLLSAAVHTLALNPDLGFDDQKPVSLGRWRGVPCMWKDGSGRYVTSLLVSAKTKDGKQASLVITIESDGGEEAFY